jgi:para-aminobenzoate synthetase / 4-amino-4-deoxychorismate lyase
VRDVRAILDLDPFGHVELAEPAAVYAADSLADVRPVIRAAEAAAVAGRWVAGFVAYEAAPAFDRALRVRSAGRGPLAWFGAFDRPVEQAPMAAGEVGEARLEGLDPDTSEAGYARAVEAIRDAIARGDAYQVNLSVRLRGRFSGDPAALYRRLHAAQGARRSVFLAMGRRAIASASPELFFERERDRLVVRPMKGTALRGRFAEEDDRIAAALAASPKERAENVMIVDLMRNDVGRVARFGSVRVEELCAVERYRTVHQMTSTVEGRLVPGTTLDDVFAALFPCGSVTGAPKSSAMKLIAALEGSPRGPYCGAIGAIAPGGRAAFNVAIRTVDLDLESGEATYGTGAGITWPSSAEAEWQETLAKARVLAVPTRPGFELIETMRVEGGRCALLPRHLARLEASARHFGFALDASAARDMVLREAAALGSGTHRLRLLLDEGGAVRLEAGAAPEAVAEPLPVALARTPVSAHDPLLFHKTTRREPYDARRAERMDVFDVVLRNEAGDVTELTIGNIVAELDGTRVTPPREAGLLAGVCRAELLAHGEIVERPLQAADLRRAGRLWLVNALRGWVPIRLVE